MTTSEDFSDNISNNIADDNIAKNNIDTSDSNQETSHISPEAEIAADVTLGHRVIIGPQVKIKEGCKIGDEVEIKGKTTLGPGTRVATGALLGFPPQHRRYDGEETTLVIGGNCNIGERSTINRGTAEKGITRLGRGVTLGALSHVAHDCRLGDGVEVGTLTQIAGLVEIGNNSSLGNAVGVHQKVMIGSGAVVVDHSKVSKDIPPYLKVTGHPARIVGTGNCPDSEVKLKITRAYELLCKAGLNTSQARDKIREELTGPEISELLVFMENSKRGICR